ncbi:MAG: segregation/condensation protein A, partial [Clostridia bacterium]|nr:segregation/condensation protein A [Clostridia bacterium]
IEQLTYRLDRFEGPLDLLLTLISKNKVTITDIPIAMICDQYMEYIENAQKMDPDIASEFIVMASELMLIKSRMILPHEEGTENDPRREIADALLLYQQAKLAAQELKPMYDEFSGRYVKGTDDIPPEKGLPLNLDTELLMKALSAVMRRIKVAESARTPVELVNPLIKHKVVSVEEKIEEICSLLEEHEEASLFFLLKDADSRAELVARFMGVLELVKINRIRITSIRVVEDVVEYEENGLEMMFTLNRDYVPVEGEASEFDSLPENTEEKEDGGDE